jgi:uncharacterized membrane protein YdjX (TVP38/TMEM64 family)
VTPPPKGPSVALQLAALAAVAALLLLSWRFGFFARAADPARLAETVVGLGAWGYLGFVLAYAALQPFGVPGTVFIVAAPLLWPWPVAFALSMVGTMAASVVGFSFSRFVARDWVTRFVPARFDKYSEALAARGFTTVVILRFVFWMPPMLHAFFGVSKVRFWTHFWGSFVGYLVPLFLVSFFGQRLFDLMRSASPATWAAMIGATALVLFAFWQIKRRRGATSIVATHSASTTTLSK